MRTSKGLIWFLIPGLLLYGIFFIFPTISAFGLGFTDWNGINPNFNFVGVQNYVDMVQDDIFKKAFGNNIKYMLFVVIFQTLFSLYFAILLFKNSKSNVFFRALFFVPTIVSSISVAFIWIFMYDASIGFLNKALTQIGLGFLAQQWLSDPKIAIFSIAIAQVWAHTGQVMIIFIAGLQSIPQSLYEVARIEGANKWQTFSKVTWPLLAPSATIVVAYTTLQTFKSFDLILAMTGGGPSYATEILSMHIYHQAFQNFKFGYASASAVLFMLIIAAITFLQFRLLKSNRVTY